MLRIILMEVVASKPMNTIIRPLYRRFLPSDLLQAHNSKVQSHSSDLVALHGLGSGTFQVAGALEYFPDRNSLIFLDGDWGVWELSLASGTCTGTWVQRASTRGEECHRS